MKRIANNAKRGQMKFNNCYDISFHGRIIVRVENFRKFKLNKETPFNNEKIVFLKRDGKNETGLFITVNQNYRSLCKNSARFFLYSIEPGPELSRQRNEFFYVLYRLPLRFKFQTIYNVEGRVHLKGASRRYSYVRFWKVPSGVLVQYLTSKPDSNTKEDIGCIHEELFMNNFEYNLFKRISNGEGVLSI